MYTQDTTEKKHIFSLVLTTVRHELFICGKPEVPLITVNQFWTWNRYWHPGWFIILNPCCSTSPLRPRLNFRKQEAALTSVEKMSLECRFISLIVASLGKLSFIPCQQTRWPLTNLWVGSAHPIISRAPHSKSSIRTAKQVKKKDSSRLLYKYSHNYYSSKIMALPKICYEYGHEFTLKV